MIKIVSDGTAKGTKVYDEYGDVIEDISKVEWRIDAESGVASVILTFCRVSVELESDCVSGVDEHVSGGIGGGGVHSGGRLGVISSGQWESPRKRA